MEEREKWRINKVGVMNGRDLSDLHKSCTNKRRQQWHGMFLMVFFPG